MNNSSTNRHSFLLTNFRRLVVLPGFAAAITLVAVINTPAQAQDKTSAQDKASAKDNTSAQGKIAEIDKIFGSAMSAGPGTPGCTVAVSQQGKPVVSRACG